VRKQTGPTATYCSDRAPGRRRTRRIFEARSHSTGCTPMRVQRRMDQVDCVATPAVPLVVINSDPHSDRGSVDAGACSAAHGVPFCGRLSPDVRASVREPAA